MYRTNTIYLSVKRTAMPNGSVSQTKGAKRCQRNIIFDGVACQPFFYPFQLCEQSHQCLCANGGWYLGDHETIIEAVDDFFVDSAVFL
jgi:hypothetical protein